MITALVRFTLPESVTIERARELFAATAPNYREVDGLLRKYYLLSEDGRSAGGVYLWRSRADAERLYTEAWADYIEQRYGARPVIDWFHSPVVVDNLAGEILDDG